MDDSPTYVAGKQWTELTEVQWLRWRVQCLEAALHEAHLSLVESLPDCYDAAANGGEQASQSNDGGAP
jgi:hypothetical protein